MPTDDRVLKLIDILPSEHAYLNQQVINSQNPFIILCDNTYNDYNIGDYLKTDYGTFWKVVGITYCCRFTENPEIDTCSWETKEKLRLNQVNHGQRDYSVIYLEKSNYNLAVGDLPDDGNC